MFLSCLVFFEVLCCLLVVWGSYIDSILVELNGTLFDSLGKQGPRWSVPGFGVQV